MTSDRWGTHDVKTTMLTRTIANPRRTTLAHLDGAEEITLQTTAGLGETELPEQTANPKRTVLMDLPDA